MKMHVYVSNEHRYLCELFAITITVKLASVSNVDAKEVAKEVSNLPVFTSVSNVSNLPVLQFPVQNLIASVAIYQCRFSPSPTLLVYIFGARQTSF
jgi:hypothetical protein